MKVSNFQPKVTYKNKRYATVDIEIPSSGWWLWAVAASKRTYEIYEFLPWGNCWHSVDLNLPSGVSEKIQYLAAIYDKNNAQTIGEDQ